MSRFSAEIKFQTKSTIDFVEQFILLSHLDPVKDFSDNVWTKDATTNPGLYDSFKVSAVARIPNQFRSHLGQVYVPYCTSDAYSGRKGASSETGGYAFYGKVQFFHISSTVSQ